MLLQRIKLERYLIKNNTFEDGKSDGLLTSRHVLSLEKMRH